MGHNDTERTGFRGGEVREELRYRVENQISHASGILALFVALRWSWMELDGRQASEIQKLLV